MKFEKLQKNKQGFIALVAVIVISIIITTVAVSVNMAGLGELVGNYVAYQSHSGFDSADACMEEALLRLRRNSGYIGGTMTLNNPCTIQIDTLGNSRTITVQSTSTTAVRTIQAQATLNGGKVTVDLWRELF